MVSPAPAKPKTDMGLRERIADHFHRAINGGIKFKATNRQDISLEFADQIIPICIETLAERFNHYLDERIADLSYIPPLSENHRKLMAARLDTYKWVKINFLRMVKELEQE